MIGVKTGETNMVYRGPTPEILDLPCARLYEHGMIGIFSVWVPSEEERKAIADGYNIRLGIFTEPIPPVSIGVTHLQKVDD